MSLWLALALELTVGLAALALLYHLGPAFYWAGVFAAVCRGAFLAGRLVRCLLGWDRPARAPRPPPGVDACHVHQQPTTFNAKHRRVR